MILVVIVASGFLFVRLTAAPKVEVGNLPDEGAASATTDAIVAKVFVTLSGSAEEVTVEGTEGAVALEETSSGIYSGEVTVGKKAGLIAVLVRWEGGEDGHRFAKLVVEVPGQKTFTHVFDATGDIDDFVELPF